LGGEGRQLSFAQELGQQLGVVEHLVVAAELRVLVFEGVEAVGTGGDDFLDVERVEHVDVLPGEHLVEVLVAGAAGRIAGAGLLRTQDGEAHAGLLQQASEGAGDLLVALVVGAGAADPVHHVDVLDADLAQHGNAQAGGPVAARAARETPRVAAGFQVVEQPLRVRPEAVLVHDQVAAHLHDLGQLVDEDGTGLDAGAARGAVPEHLVRDHGAYQGRLLIVGLRTED
jgi:hypothetical protein